MAKKTGEKVEKRICEEPPEFGPDDPLCHFLGISRDPVTKLVESQFSIVARVPGTEMYLLRFREWGFGQPSTAELRSLTWLHEHHTEFFLSMEAWHERGTELMKQAEPFWAKQADQELKAAGYGYLVSDEAEGETEH